MNTELLSAIYNVDRVADSLKFYIRELDDSCENLRKKLLQEIVIKPNLQFSEELQPRALTKYILFHHRAGCGSVESLHDLHLNHGWAGIGYHLYVDLKGKIYQGRPLGVIGAHCYGWNRYSIGICFEGDYTKIQKMPDKQFEAALWAVQICRTAREGWDDLQVLGHKDKYNTKCPGNYFPLNMFKSLLNKV
jgi:hypothetical protein